MQHVIVSAIQVEHAYSRRGVSVVRDTCDGMSASMNWTGTKVLDISSSYSIKWLISSGRITLQAEANAPGISWIGIGISEVGHMLGADVITLIHTTGTDGLPNVTLSDSHVLWYPFNPYNRVQVGMRPTLDTYQSARLLCSSRSSTRLMGIFSRRLDTNDQQDRPIIEGPQPVIYAWGFSPSSVEYHGVHRGTATVTFINSPTSVDPPDAGNSVSVVFSSGFLTSNITRKQYICQSFNLGEDNRHVIVADAILKGAAANLAQHILIHQCGVASFGNYQLLHSAGPGPCLNPLSPNAVGESPLGSKECRTVLYGWHRGGSKLVTPDVTGLPIGKRWNLFFILEVLVDNPNGLALDIGALGINLTIATAMRRYHAGTMITGDYEQSLSNSSIQSRFISNTTTSAHYETTCSSACTANFSRSLSVFASLLHMGLAGRETFLTKTSKALVSMVDYRQFWTAGLQVVAQTNFTIDPGDQLNLHCIYDGSQYTSRIGFGAGTYDETCLGVLYFYPAGSGVEYCGMYNDVSTCNTFRKRIVGEENPIKGITFLPLTCLFVLSSDFCMCSACRWSD